MPNNKELLKELRKEMLSGIIKFQDNKLIVESEEYELDLVSLWEESKKSLCQICKKQEAFGEKVEVKSGKKVKHCQDCRLKIDWNKVETTAINF